MTTTSSVGNSGNIGAALNKSGATDPSSAQSIQNQFLTLLTTQLKNQDPLNPMDNSALTSQLAQISTVEGITNLNTTLQAIGSQINASQAIDTAGLLGASVLVGGSDILLGTNKDTGGRVTTPFGIDLQGAATNVTVQMFDSSGNLVNSIDLGAQKPGILSYSWDGNGATGAALPDGKYSFAVKAVGADGSAVTADPLTYGQVASVAYGSNGPILNLGSTGTASLGDIRKIFGASDDGASI
jgi:flagellar basal-body rod modification protein FlgD